MYISIPRDWSNVVRDRRTDLKMTQEELAARVGKARQWVVRFESGHAGSANIDSLTKLLAVLELNVEVDATDEDPDPMFMLDLDDADGSEL
ncbi:MAG TPA: hypothetical protein DIW46_01125 [Microbacterium sp.]|uniref:helix-turn-helix transcriptional regulator n=1 Tax=Microbacterium sp. TaxID=51671 RepID=UPI000ED8DE9B|nr:hypothetical protein [Microbacterium sp.]